MLGKILGGRYELIEKIGSGGMANVYKAKCHLLKRYVAVKVLRTEFVEDEEFVSRFKRESQAAASLSHSNIVNIYDVGQEDDIHYIVMEYVKGETLKDYIVKNRILECDEAIRIALQISAALKHAHKNNIVHRDIKPQNILISDDGNIKVTDFGIARAITSATVTLAGANVIGSVHYFSPEQARGGYVDIKSDLYSLGIVIYEMVTGVVPFEGDSAISVALKHMQEQVKPPGEVNPNIIKSLQGIIEKLIEKDQNKRYQSADEIINDLQQALRNPEIDFVQRNFDSNSPTQIVRPLNGSYESSIDKEDTTKKYSKIKKVVIVSSALIALFLLIWITFIVGRSILRRNFSTMESEVPNIENLSLEVAKEILQEKNLVLNISGERNDADIDRGNIISQDPKAGMVVAADSNVNVIVSLGPKMVTVPEVTGKSKGVAERELTGLGLKVEGLNYVPSELPMDYVVNQDIPKGTEVSEGSVINITLSSGPENNAVVVGNYTGMLESAARELILNDGLEIGKVETEYSDEVNKGLVIRQNPPSGNYVEENRKVDIWVSMGQRDHIFKKELRINLPQDRDTVRIRIVRNHDRVTIYNETHNTSKEYVEIEVEGKGQVTYDIFVDDKYSRMTLDFTKKEDGR